MSRIVGQEETASVTQARSWEKPAAADDIVDPIEGGPGIFEADAADREQSDEEAEDVPLDVRFTDALSMLADGGHDYGSRPVVEEELDDAGALEGEPTDYVEIDESSKDA